jgi:hypothetical protein
MSRSRVERAREIGETSVVAVSMRDPVFVGSSRMARTRFTVFTLVVRTFLLRSVTRWFGKTTFFDRSPYFEGSWASFLTRFPSFLVARASEIRRLRTIFARKPSVRSRFATVFVGFRTGIDAKRSRIERKAALF